MAGRERESSESWGLPERRRPPLVGELEARIDEALATAKAAEAGVMTVGAAALDAAEQARRAAELAERAAGSVAAGRPPTAPVTQSSAGPSRWPAEPSGGSLEDFDARADRLMERLRRLQRVPLGPARTASAPPRAQP